MNKKAFIAIIAFILIIVAAVAYLLVQAPEASTPRTTTSSTEQEDPRTAPATEQDKAETDAVQSSPARYIEYSQSTFEETKGTQVLFFHADWCPQCRALDADLEANIGSLSDVTIYKVDYDTELDLRKQYGVTQQTTVVKTDGEGTELDSFVAYDSPTLESVRENLDL